MKKSFNKLDKIQIVIGSVALLLAIFGFVYDNLTEIACILISINLLVNETRNIRKGKKSIFFIFDDCVGDIIIFLFNPKVVVLNQLIEC